MNKDTGSSKKRVTKVRKAVIFIEAIETKERKAVGFDFKNKEMSCSCLNGRCPHYESHICGSGGRAVYRQVSRKMMYRKIKRTLYRDPNISPWR